MGMAKWNKLALSDSYKYGHYAQYPPGTERIYSYFESRGKEHKYLPDYTVFYGLQYYLDMLSGQFVTEDRVARMQKRCQQHFGNDHNFNRCGWNYILSKHEGRLPVVIKAVDEGSVIPLKNVLMTVENTDPNVPWLTNWLETLLVKVWYPCTVATNSRYMKGLIRDALARCGEDPALANDRLHCFGFRGVSSNESAAIGSSAHLINFRGTDTVLALDLIEDIYGEECAGFSCPASEHSTITSWGRDRESEALRNMLEKYPYGVVACVSDSYNIFHTCKQIWGSELRDKILLRDGVLLIRPDSGNHVHTLFNKTNGIIHTLFDAFGGTVKSVNGLGYRWLNPKVRIVVGDGIEVHSIKSILDAFLQNYYAPSNLYLGSGGGLLQKVNRDTYKFAFKCSSAVIDGKTVDVFKDPITDPGKTSKKGRLALVHNGDRKYTTLADTVHNRAFDCLKTVFRDGNVVYRHSFNDVRSRARFTNKDCS